jgi:hypothetical protein
MDIVRNDDGTLIVPVTPERLPSSDDATVGRPGGPGRAGGPGGPGRPADGDERAEHEPSTRLLHPGEGGYDEALAEWDLQQNPDRPPAVSTASGREQAMAVVHAVASSPDHEVAPAVEALADPEASGEALRHVLVGGVHSVEDFAAEVAEAEGGEPLPPHQATRIIGEVLAELD